MPLEAVLTAVNEITKEVAKEVPQKAKTIALDKPLNTKDVKESFHKDINSANKIKELDKPLNLKETGKIEKMARMEPPVEIKFKCPPGMDRTEYRRQLKGQERGLNSQTVEQNIKNRNAFEQRKIETGNGRDIETSKKAQEITRQKALQKRIESNQAKGMSYSEAKSESQSWIKKQAALHNPDQIAGGDPAKVSRMGNKDINASIGSQWRKNVNVLKNDVDNFAKGKSNEELANTKMNVKLVMV